MMFRSAVVLEDLPLGASYLKRFQLAIEFGFSGIEIGAAESEGELAEIRMAISEFAIARTSIYGFRETVLMPQAES